MFHVVAGNLFAEKYDVIAQGCNTYGLMGAGFALSMAQNWPIMRREYIEFCSRGFATPGGMHVHTNMRPGHEKYMDGRLIAEDNQPKYIVNLFSQVEPGRHANIKYIALCFWQLSFWIPQVAVKRIGMPAIGCGIGGLDFSDVQGCAKVIFGDDPAYDVFMYEPGR